MNRTELVNLLKSLNIPINEGVTSQKNFGALPRIDFWEFVMEDVVASGVDYDEIDTYQISFYSKIPRDPKLLELRDKLRKMNIHPTIQIEINEKDRIVHSYFSLEAYRDEQ